MSSFRLQSFDAILEGVHQAIEWFRVLHIKTGGTRLETIEARIKEIIEGISRPDRDDYFRNRAHRSDYWAIVDGASFKEIWEQFHTLPSNRVPRGLLRDSIQGQALDPEEEQPGTGTENARNFQAQLEIAAQIAASGVPIVDFDDVGFRFTDIPFLMECKRISRPGQVADNVAKANSQIERKLAPYGRALIAIAPEKLLNIDGLDPFRILGGGPELEKLVLGFTANFYNGYRFAFSALDQRVIGIMLMFRFVCHDLSHGGYSVARYSVITPTYRDDHPDRQLVEDFGRCLKSDMESR